MDFSLLQIWVQVHGLSLDMYNSDNPRRIGNKVGRCIMIKPDQVMHHKSFMRLKLEINTEEPLLAGFWWSNMKGEEKLDSIKYECLPDFCYACGRMGHTSQICANELIMSELKPGFPLYGPWLFGLRPRVNNIWFMVGGRSSQNSRPGEMERRS